MQTCGTWTVQGHRCQREAKFRDSDGEMRCAIHCDAARKAREERSKENWRVKQSKQERDYDLKSYGYAVESMARRLEVPPKELLETVRKMFGLTTTY